MAHNILSKKLDQVEYQKLGFDFDEDAIWSRLEARLDKKPIPLANRRLFAAMIFLAVLLVPLSMLHESRVNSINELTASTPQDQTPDIALIQAPAPQQNIQEQVKKVNVIYLESKKINLCHAPIDLKAIKIVERVIDFTPGIASTPQFAAEDISIIQANLEGPTIEKGNNLSIRAQWKTDPGKVNVNYHALKIKLYEKEN